MKAIHRFPSFLAVAAAVTLGHPFRSIAGEGNDAFFALRHSVRFTAEIASSEFEGGVAERGAPAFAASQGPSRVLAASPAESVRTPLPAGAFAHPPGRASGGDLFFAMGIGMLAASAGDLLTTEVGLSQGAYETNPLQGNRMVRITTHAAVPALLWWVTSRAQKSGKTKLALAMRIGFAAAYGYVTLHNSRTIGAAP